MKQFRRSIIIFFFLFSTTSLASDEDLEKFGDIMQFALPIAGLAGTYIADDKEGRWQFTYSLVTAVGTTTVLKGVYGKLRPSSSSRTSFPSGHTTAAFQGAGFIDMRYGHKYGIPAYILAGITGYSRFVSDNHFADDILAGASIGVMSNLYWVTPYQQDAVITPVVMGDGVGVAVTINDTDGLSKKPMSDKTTPRGRYQLSLGTAKLKENQITSPADTGTTFDLSQFDLIDDPTSTAVGSFDWYVAPRHTVSFIISPFESRDTGQFSNPVSFGGSTFPANTPLRSSWRMTDLSAYYYYDLTRQKNWNFNIGGGLSYQRTVIELRTEDNAVTAKVSDEIVLPFLYLAADVNFAHRWKVGAEASVWDSSEDKFLSSTLFMNYKINRNWDAGFGVGVYRRDINTNELDNRVKYDLAFISIGYTFY